MEFDYKLCVPGKQILMQTLWAYCVFILKHQKSRNSVPFRMTSTSLTIKVWYQNPMYRLTNEKPWLQTVRRSWILWQEGSWNIENAKKFLIYRGVKLFIQPRLRRQSIDDTHKSNSERPASGKDLRLLALCPGIPQDIETTCLQMRDLSR